MTVRMRATRAHTGNRRSHHSLVKPALAKDNESGTFHLRHRASAVTGMYRGRQVIDVNAALVKKAEKRKNRQSQMGDEATATSAKESQK